jgi:hypothetical protein
MKTVTSYRPHRADARRAWAFLAAFICVTLTKFPAAAAQDFAEIQISCQAVWNSESVWEKEFKDSDDKPYRMGLGVSETVSLVNDVRFQNRDGDWEEIEGKPTITVSGAGVYSVTGKNAVNKTVNSFPKEPLETNALVHIRTLDLEQGYAILTVAKPETESRPECIECGFIALAAMMDCMDTIAANIANPRPEEYRLEFPPGSKEFSATQSFGWSQSGPCGSDSITATFTISYTPGKWEAVIIPPPDFEQWLPAGGIDGDKPGGSLGISVQLRHKGEKVPAEDMTGTFYVTLEKVSRQPGVCVNAPPKDKAGTDPDLRLQQTDDFWISDDEGLRGQSAEDSNEQSVTIDCYDFGAFGRLRVEVVANDGTKLQAHLEADPGKDYFDIPKDDNSNHIPDGWEEDNSVPEGLPPTWDEAENPAGQRTLGDGISLYEKYRGFFVGGNHRRLDPHRKYLFVYDPTGWAQLSTTEPGGMSFIQALDCEVLFIQDKQWTGPGGSGAKKRMVNFNSTDEVRATEQHALHLRFPFTDSPLYPADYNDMLMAKYGTNDTQIRTDLGLTFPDLSASRWDSPAGWIGVEIYANNIDKEVRRIALWHTKGLPEFALYNDPATTDAEKARLDARAKALLDEYIRDNATAFESRNWRRFTAIVAHEIGHGLGVKDLLSPSTFGPSNCVMRYFEWPGSRLPNDRFELAARNPWPDIYCLSAVGTEEGIACWKQINFNDRSGATRAPAAAGFSPLNLAGPSIREKHRALSPLAAVPNTGIHPQATQVVKPPNLAVATELLWNDLLAGDPLRIEMHLSCPAYQEALVESQRTGQPIPANVFRPTIRTNWHENLYFTLYSHFDDNYIQVLDSREWKLFLRPESVSPSCFGQKMLTQSREWFLPAGKIQFEPGEYVLSVSWDGDGMVEEAALPSNGFVSAAEVRFQVAASTNTLQQTTHEHRLAFDAYVSGDYRKALDHALLALGQNDARTVLLTEGTHMLAANAALKLQDYRTAAVLLQDAGTDGVGEPFEAAHALRRALTPEIVLNSNPGLASSRRLTVVALPGQNYEVQSSLDLIQWTPVDSRFSTTNRYEIMDAASAGERQRFYRVAWRPL